MTRGTGASSRISDLPVSLNSEFARKVWPSENFTTSWRPGTHVTAGSGRGHAGSLPVVTVLAADTALWLAGTVFVLGVVVLVLLVWAPWKSVRNEPPLPDDVETRLLLGEDPEQIAADEDAAERHVRRASVIDLAPDSAADEGDGTETA